MSIFSLVLEFMALFMFIRNFWVCAKLTDLDFENDLQFIKTFKNYVVIVLKFWVWDSKKFIKTKNKVQTGYYSKNSVFVNNQGWCITFRIRKKRCVNVKQG